MRRCGKCGAAISDLEDICPYCGAEYREGEAPAAPDIHPLPEGTAAESGAGSLPMKWHKFQMVTMIIGAVMTMINGIGTMSGTSYTSLGLSAQEIYSRYPGLKTIDLLFGAGAIIIGVYQLYVRNQLNAFRRNAPGRLKILYIAAIAFNALNMLAVSSVLKTDSLDTHTFFLSCLSTVAALVINHIYYSKRSGMFVN